MSFVLDFKYGCYIYCDAIAVHDIYSIYIDEIDKMIEFNSIDGFVLANISNWSDIEECGYVEYDEYDNLKPFDNLLIENGKLTYKKGDD